ASDLIATYGIGRVAPAVPGLVAEFVALDAPAKGLLLASRVNEIPNVAKFAGRAGMDYRTAISDELNLRVAASVRYIGRSRLGIGPILGERQGDYLDTALTARIGHEGFGVTLGITNLTDSIGNRFALGTPFDTTEQITPLR